MINDLATVKYTYGRLRQTIHTRPICNDVQAKFRQLINDLATIKYTYDSVQNPHNSYLLRQTTPNNAAQFKVYPF